MIENGTMVKDEFGELFVVLEVTSKVVLCCRYSHQDKPAAFVFNPYQLQEVLKKGIVVDKNV